MKFTKVHMVLIGIVTIVLASAGVVGFMCRDRFMGYMEGLLVRVGGSSEGFSDARPCSKCNLPKPMCGCKKPSDICNSCGNPNSNCGCNKSNSSCNSCGKPKPNCGCPSGSASGSGSSSASKYGVVAPCPRVMEPDLSKYILKSQIPTCNRAPLPEMSNYMLKTECPPVPDLSKYILKSSIPKPQPVIIDNSKCKTESGECPPCPRPRCPVVKCPAPTKCAPPAPCPRPVCPPTVVKCKSEESTQPTVRPFLAPLNMGGFGSS